MLKPSLFYLIGLPGSGKSTYAKKLQKELQNEGENTIHLSSDLIRKELYGDESCQDNPQQVFELMRFRTVENLKKGNNVIYDATNLTRKHRIAFLKSLPKELVCNKICIIVWAKIETCIARDSLRERKVGMDVIKKMVSRFMTPDFEEGWDGMSVKLTDFPYKYKVLSSTLLNLPHDNSHHKPDSVLDHIIRVENEVNKLCELEKGELRTLKYLAKVHDIGKIYTKTFSNFKGEVTEDAHYYQHQNVGAYMILGLNLSTEPYNPTTEDQCLNEGQLLYLSYLTLLHMEPFFKNPSKCWKDADEDIKHLLYLFNKCDKLGA